MNGWTPIARTDRLFRRPALEVFDRVLADLHRPVRRQAGGRWRPAIDVSETESAFVVRLEVPGIDKEDLEITCSDGLLTLSGEKRVDEEAQNADTHYRERRFGRFRRTLRIPDSVRTDAIDAAYKNGVLRVTLPKRTADRTRKVTIGPGRAG